MFVYKIKIPRAKSDPIFETPIFVTNRDAERYWPLWMAQSSTRPTFFSLPINACGAIAKKGEKKSGDCAVGNARGARACDRSIVTKRVRRARAYIGIFKIKIYVSLERGYLGKRKSDRGKKRLPRIHHVDFKFANIFASVVTTIDWTFVNFEYGILEGEGEGLSLEIRV